MKDDKGIIRKFLEFLIAPAAVGIFWVSALVSRTFKIDGSTAYAFTMFGVLISAGIIAVALSIVAMAKDSEERTFSRLFMTGIGVILTGAAIHLLATIK